MNNDASPRYPAPESRYIRKLVERIRSGDDKKGGGCVLLLGPGVAVDPASSARTPLASMLARRLAEEPRVRELCDPRMHDNLRFIAQLYYETKRDQEDLALAVDEFYRGFQGLTTDFHRNLARLPIRLCISTSADDFMLRAFEDVGKRPNRAHYNFRRERSASTPRPTEQSPLVYYLYGHGDDLESLVLTEENLIEFLVKVVKGEPDLPDYIKGQLGDRDTTFLFLGFGFHNWYLRVLLHVLKIYGHQSRAMALENTEFFEHPEHLQTVGFFSGERAIEFRPLGWDDFAQRVCDEYLSIRPASPVPVPAVASGAPRAFLCYASEDREAVDELGARLGTRGIAVWQDKQNLRGGANWDRVLVDVIEKQVDYVIVVQSRQMTSRLEGYFNKEIDVALARLQRFSQGAIFVIPVTLDDGPVVSGLENLHALDVSGPPGIDALTGTILSDWTERSRRSAQSVARGGR